MSLQSSFIEPLESTFNFNALLKFEKSNNKFYHLNKENNFEEDENSLNKDCYSSESFSENLLSFQKELQRKNLFNPVPFESKKNDQNSMPNSFFGAFINSSISIYELNSNNKIIKCGIPQFTIKETNFESDEKKFESDLNKYLNIYDENDEEKMDYSRKNSYDKNKENLDYNYQLEPYINKNYTDLFLNYSKTSQYFLKIKTIPQLLIEKNIEKLNSYKNNYKSNCDINYLSYNLEETLLFNPFKIINYELSLQKNFKNLIYKLHKPADPLEFYPLLIYLLQGIPSNLFEFNNLSLTFELTDINFRFITCLHKISKNFLKFFIDFGTKMYLIGLVTEYYLYNKHPSSNYSSLNNDIKHVTPFIIKKFFSQINLLLIKINENILKIKNELLTNKINLTGLFNKLQNFIGIVNMIYQILNLQEAVEKYSQHNILSENISKKNTSHFLRFYEECNLNLKSHKLIDSLFNILYSFNYSNTNNYEIIKNTLLCILKSYLQFIVYLIFDTELIDESNEYFIIKNNDNFCLDKNKVPNFLQDYKNIIMNNTILLNYIKKLDNDYFNVTNYKINEIIYFIEKFSFNNFYEQKQSNENPNLFESYELDNIHNFIEFKDKIFNKKIELMFIVNEKICNDNEFIKNDLMLKKLTHIRILKEFMSLKDEYNREKKEIEIQRKRKYHEAIQNQIFMKRKAIEEDIIRIKEEKIEQIKRQKENEIYQNEIIENLKMKYNRIIDETKDIEKFLTGEKIKIWQNKRLNNKAMRYNIFEKMFDIEKIREIYLDYSKSSNIIENYHFFNNKITYEYSGSAANKYLIEDNPIMENLIIPQISQNLSNINLCLKKGDKIFQENLIEKSQSISLEKDKIDGRNIIITNTLNHKKKYSRQNQNDFSMYENKELLSKLPEFFSNSIVPLDSEVTEILNKMKVIILETGVDRNSTSSCNNLYLQKSKKLEIPIQVILQEFFYDIIIKQYKIVNNCFTLMLKNKFHLRSHFEFFSNIFLCKSGDLIMSFIDNCIDFKTLTLISNEEEYLYDSLKNEFVKKFSQYEMIENLKFLKFSKVNKFNLKYSVTNIEMAYKLDYKASTPVNFIFTSKIITLYNSLHIYFFKLKIYQSVTNRIFLLLKNQKSSNNGLFNKIFKILFKCKRILNNVYTFIFDDILNNQWNETISLIEATNDVYVLTEANISLLNKMNFMINNPIMTHVNKLNLRLAKFYLKVISEDSEYFDFDSLKIDNSFLKNLKKMETGSDNLKKLIIEENIIGDFHNLKKYI